MTGLEILGLGTALPAHKISQQAAAVFAASCVKSDTEEQRQSARPDTGTLSPRGVRQRHSVLLESSSDGEATAERFYRFAATADDRGPSTADRMQRYRA
ncbi:MAG UNVERIFIED_CONTAM: hypothetical protein LVR18_45390 [Planctomycetaceae bacterium]|jgi:hypothetical protein